MYDIGDFATRSATEFLKKQSAALGEYRLEIAREEVERLVRTAFYASLIPDEGRWPKVAIMCYRKETQPHFYFPHSIAITPRELAKLAHAVQANSHICCLSDAGELKIAGINVTRLNDHPELGYATFRTPNPLKLVIRGPGHIDFSSGGRAIEYRAGDIREESLLMMSVVVESLSRNVNKELQDDVVEPLGIIPDIINDLVGKISQLGHGGLIIFADAPKKTHFSPHRELLWCDILTDALAEYSDCISSVADAVDGIPLIQRIKDDESVPGLLSIALSVSKIEKALETIANLSGMDGAIVFDTSLRIGAFNAIIDRSMECPHCVLTDGTGTEIDETRLMQHRGSRHQAALLFCKSVPNSFAFVISQDGAVTAFHNSGQAVVSESEMRVM